MNSQSRSGRRTTARALAVVLVAVCAAGLAGCSSSALVDHIPTAVGGLPEGVPERPAAAISYPAVHDIPTNRGPTVLSDNEKKRLRDDLAKTREHNVLEAQTPAETIDISPPAGGARN